MYCKGLCVCHRATSRHEPAPSRREREKSKRKEEQEMVCVCVVCVCVRVLPCVCEKVCFLYTQEEEEATYKDSNIFMKVCFN